MPIFATTLKNGLMAVSLGEIKYQRRNTIRIKTTKLKMDKQRKPHLFSERKLLFTFLPLVMPQIMIASFGYRPEKVTV
jgi:hypothetical protein